MERIEKTGMPSMVTMSFDKDPKSYDGHSPAECARALRDAGADIIGVNCLRNPLLLLPLAREMRQAVSGFVACQPTAYSTPPDVPDFTATKEFPFETETLVLSRKVMGAFAAEARAAGINYIGSCCGSMPVHVREMARAREGARRPDVARGLCEADVRVRVLQTPDVGRSRHTSAWRYAVSPCQERSDRVPTQRNRFPQKKQNMLSALTIVPQLGQRFLAAVGCTTVTGATGWAGEMV